MHLSAAPTKPTSARTVAPQNGGFAWALSIMHPAETHSAGTMFERILEH
jgi:hypothetical protein